MSENDEEWYPDLPSWWIYLTKNQYVQDLILPDGASIAERLNEGGCLRICSAIGMQNEVLVLLEQLCQQHLDVQLNHFQVKGQVLMDCY